MHNVTAWSMAFQLWLQRLLMRCFQKMFLSKCYSNSQLWFSLLDLTALMMALMDNIKGSLLLFILLDINKGCDFDLGYTVIDENTANCLTKPTDQWGCGTGELLGTRPWIIKDCGCGCRLGICLFGCTFTLTTDHFSNEIDSSYSFINLKYVFYLSPNDIICIIFRMCRFRKYHCCPR